MKYRAEIDGLRALAVVPVILFHAGFELFSGGFVGVDVFFVISGYLITTILIDDIENKRFSIVNFYERRARRILPALFFVMLVCIPFAWMWMLPSQMKDFSQSLVAVSLFASNILFWRESGYFDAAADEKPLLHTWSLAVEEQYYVLFPIFLILAWRFGKNRVFWMIVVMATISLLLSEWGWRKQPTANFYLAPTRAWELFAGSIAAFIVQKQGVQKNNLLATVGLAAIVFSIFFYDETTPFPSVYALVPVIGVVLLVLFGEKDTVAAKLLSTKAFVGIGLISYSAYLWHQPLFAFARIKYLDEPPVLIYLFLSLGSLVLAVMSWKYIEKPFRNKELIPAKSILAISGVGIFLFSLIGINLPNVDMLRFNKTQQLIISDGEANRLLMKNSAYDRYGCFFDYSQDASQLISKGCVANSSKPRLILFGDSEAAHLYEGMLMAFPNRHVMQFTGTSCRAIDFPKNNERCKKFYSLFLTEIIPHLENDDIVIVSSNWWNTFRKIGVEEFSSSLRDIVLAIKQKTRNVFIFSNAPGFPNNPYETLAITLNGNAEPSVFLNSQPILVSDLVIQSVGAEVNVAVYDVAKLLCKADGKCLFKDSQDYLYFDTGHLSYYGSEFVSKAFREFLNGLKNE